jgi:hypothetical protein
MSFLVQFLRSRRGVPEVVRTLHLPAATAAGALNIAKTRVGAASWPMRITALRVMDDGGRTLIEWLVPKEAPLPTVDTVSMAAQHRMAVTTTSPARLPLAKVDTERPDHQSFEIGQAVTYATDAQPDIWRGGFDIMGRSRSDDTQRYRIRSADEKSDRNVRERNLREDLGARTRGQ